MYVQVNTPEICTAMLFFLRCRETMRRWKRNDFVRYDVEKKNHSFRRFCNIFIIQKSCLHVFICFMKYFFGVRFTSLLQNLRSLCLDFCVCLICCCFDGNGVKERQLRSHVSYICVGWLRVTDGLRNRLTA